MSSVPAFTVDQLRAALRQALPGLPVQMRMSPRPRPGSERILDPGLDCRHAAVLLLVYPCQGELCLVLTRRTELVNAHQGQISLPGGSMDPGEEARDTALREAQEELAIDPAALELLGELSAVYIPPSGFCVHPVVAYVDRRPDFLPFAAEVAEVIEEPLSHLALDGTCREEIWPLRGEQVRVPFYAVGPHKVWGATAMVLCEFLALLQTAGDTGS
jgi:8-oxo-dGTP pyrophosphatase MutT (NUDIX family)